MSTPAPATFAKLLEDAVNEPGILSSAYSAFHNYSIGNQLLAWSQCLQPGIQAGADCPLPSAGKELGRYLRRGERAITFCRPVTSSAQQPPRRGKRNNAPTWFA